MHYGIGRQHVATGTDEQACDEPLKGAAGLQPQVRQARMIVRSAAERPMKFAICRIDWEIVDGGVSTLLKARGESIAPRCYRSVATWPGLIALKSAAIWLTGFGIGSRMPRERQSQDPPEFLAGTPVYMSPYARRFGSHSDHGIADTLVQFPRSDASDVIGLVASKYPRSLS